MVFYYKSLDKVQCILWKFCHSACYSCVQYLSETMASCIIKHLHLDVTTHSRFLSNLSLKCLLVTVFWGHQIARWLYSCEYFCVCVCVCVCDLSWCYRYIGALFCCTVACWSQHCRIPLCFHAGLDGAWLLGIPNTDHDELYAL